MSRDRSRYEVERTAQGFDVVLYVKDPVRGARRTVLGRFRLDTHAVLFRDALDARDAKAEGASA